jgi:hypothetical protein
VTEGRVDDAAARAVLNEQLVHATVAAPEREAIRIGKPHAEAAFARPLDHEHVGG